MHYRHTENRLNGLERRNCANGVVHVKESNLSLKRGFRDKNGKLLFKSSDSLTDG